MRLKRKLPGYTSIRVTSADIPSVLQACNQANIEITRVIWDSDLSVILSLKNIDFCKARKIIEKRGGTCEHFHRLGFMWILNQIRRRSLFLFAIGVFFTLTVWIPSRIYFVEVIGNKNISTNFIIQTAENLGLKFGCRREAVRSEKLKNLMLEAVPDLEWVGITTSGCVATIEIRENIKQNPNNAIFGSIVADCDGIIKSVTATKGKALCKTGDAVKKGQVLVSGYEDCGLAIRYTGAEGEVYAETYRVISLKTPSVLYQRQNIKEEKKDFSLRIGKNLIKFSKDSGISPSGCVKMYKERFITLPGGFQLPISFVQEHYLFYSTEEIILPEETFAWMEQSADFALQSLIQSGVKMRKYTEIICLDNCAILRGVYLCTEQIGKYRYEEFPDYG